MFGSVGDPEMKLASSLTRGPQSLETRNTLESTPRFQADYPKGLGRIKQH